MYGSILTARAKAKLQGDGVAEIVMNEEAREELRVDENTICNDTPETAPVRFGLSGDYEVVEGEHNIVLAEDGTTFTF